MPPGKYLLNLQQFCFRILLTFTPVFVLYLMKVLVIVLWSFFQALLRIYLCARDHISTEEHVDEFHFLPASDFMLIKVIYPIAPIMFC